MRINTIEELEELMYSPNCKEISSSPTKHDCHITTYVIKIDDKYWQFAAEFSYNNGIQFWGSIECDEVEPVSVTVIKYIKKNEIREDRNSIRAPAV